MSLTIQWEGGDGVTLLPSGSYIGFYGNTFNSAIPLNGYNSLTTGTNILGTTNLGELPNVKYTSPGFATWTNVTNGVTSGSIAGVSFDDCTLHIRITSGSLCRLSAVNLIAFSGDLNTAPPNANVMGFEQGTSNWVTMAALASPLALTPHISSGSFAHDYYVSISVAPTIAGAAPLVSFAIIADWY